MKLSAEQQLRCKAKQGRPPLGVEMKLTDDENRPSPRDGRTFGRLKVRGFAVAKSYLNWDGESIVDLGIFRYLRRVAHKRRSARGHVRQDCHMVAAR